MYALGIIIKNANICNNDPTKCKGIKFEAIPAWVIVKGAIWSKPHVRNYQNYDFLTGTYGIFIQNYLNRRYLDEPYRDISWIPSKSDTNSEMGFYQTYRFQNTNRTAKIRIYYSFSHPIEFNNNFRLKVTKTSGENLNINAMINHGNNDKCYYNEICSFSRSGPSTNASPTWSIYKYTNQEIRDIHLFDRWVFETSKFLMKDSSVTVIILPIPRFALQLYSIELIVD
ncbi:hypothetical protein ACTA71_005430 [Dictyostelium dimigraforme]